MSGYVIKQIMEKISKLYWSESNAQIYPTLKALEKSGFVDSILDESSGARKARIYTITKPGIAHLSEWLLQPVGPTRYRETILLHLAMGHHLKPQQMIDQVKAYELMLKGHLTALNGIDDHIRVYHNDMPDKPYLEIVYLNVRMVLNTRIEWCKLAVRKLKSLDKKR